MEDEYSADHLAQIFGTEKDRVNCTFYYKMGACRHGSKCDKTHNKPVQSQTILIPNMYPNPQATPMLDQNNQPVEYDRSFLKNHFNDFYEDVFQEFSKYGEILELNVCDNIALHLLGNVYIKYKTEEQAIEAKKNIENRYYAGILLKPEFSPVTNFYDARCKQYEDEGCERKGLCNFIHLKKPSRSLAKKLLGSTHSSYLYNLKPGRGYSRHRHSQTPDKYHHHGGHRSSSDHHHHHHHGRRNDRRRYGYHSSERNGRRDHENNNHNSTVPETIEEDIPEFTPRKQKRYEHATEKNEFGKRMRDEERGERHNYDSEHRDKRTRHDRTH